MSADRWRLAYPHVVRDERRQGTAIDWSETCERCPTRQCEVSQKEELQLCSYGFNFQRVSSDLVIAGILVKEFQPTTPARTKNFRKYPNWIIPLAHLQGSVNSVAEVISEEEHEIQTEKTQILDKYVRDEQYKKEFLDVLKPEIQKGLSFVHDYKQINSQIAQNINVIIETKYQGVDLEEKLKLCSHAEAAIYWSSKFLQEKLNVARFLIQPEWITRESEKGLFRVHGLVLKYVRIYQHMFDSKSIRVSVNGHSVGNVLGNSGAAGVIPHTLLDNALKYSPDRERVEVYVNDDAAGIEFSVSSYGPRIEDYEEEKIFQAFYRGGHAQKLQEEGAGYGLYVAQLVAKALRASITVDQNIKQMRENRYWTTFKVVLPYG